MSIETDLDPRVDISREDLKVLIYQSVRELLFNVNKHSGTNTARISMTVDESGDLCIAVSDKGVGFDPDRTRKLEGHYSGYGLFSIQERLASLGGSFEIESAPGNGATCKLIAPLKEYELSLLEESMITEKNVTTPVTTGAGHTGQLNLSFESGLILLF